MSAPIPEDYAYLDQQTDILLTENRMQYERIAALQAQVQQLREALSDPIAVELTKWLRERAQECIAQAKSRRGYADAGKNLTSEDQTVAHHIAEQMMGRKLPRESPAEKERGSNIQKRVAAKLENEAANLNAFADYLAALAALAAPEPK